MTGRSRCVTQFEEGRGTHLEARRLKAEDLDAFQKIFLHLLTIKHVGFNCFWNFWKLSLYWLKTNLHNISHVLRRDLARGEFAPRVGSQCRLFCHFHYFDQQGRTLCSRRFLNLGITKVCLTLASFLNQCNGALMWQATIGQTRV